MASSCHKAQSSPHSPQQEPTMEMGYCARTGLPDCQGALQADSLLVHYDTTKPIVLACDASQYGISVVLSHVVDAQKRNQLPTLREHIFGRTNYSQIERKPWQSCSQWRNSTRWETFLDPLSFPPPQRNHSDSTDGILQDPTLGDHTVGVWLHYSIQGWEASLQCWCLQSLTTFSYSHPGICLTLLLNHVHLSSISGSCGPRDVNHVETSPSWCDLYLYHDCLNGPIRLIYSRAHSPRWKNAGW